jgi:hypothetical protein
MKAHAKGPIDPFARHKEARDRLAAELDNYTGKLVPELENVLSAKTLVTAQTEATNDLEKLDGLCIRLRSLEILEKSISAKTDASEKWMQETLAIHVERDARLSAFLDETLIAEAIAQLGKYFAEIPPELEMLGCKTRIYLEGRVKPVLFSYAWAQPLAPITQKIEMGIRIHDPIYEPPKREDIVSNLLAAVSDTLTAEEQLFMRRRTGRPGSETPHPLATPPRSTAPPGQRSADA